MISCSYEVWRSVRCLLGRNVDAEHLYVRTVRVSASWIRHNGYSSSAILVERNLQSVNELSVYCTNLVSRDETARSSGVKAIIS